MRNQLIHPPVEIRDVSPLYSSKPKLSVFRYFKTLIKLHFEAVAEHDCWMHMDYIYSTLLLIVITSVSDVRPFFLSILQLTTAKHDETFLSLLVCQYLHLLNISLSVIMRHCEKSQPVV